MQHLFWVNDRDINQIDHIIAREIGDCQRVLQERLNAIYSERASSGRLQSETTVARAVTAIHEKAARTLERILSKVKEVSVEPRAFEKIAARISILLDELHEQVKDVIKIASGRAARLQGEAGEIMARRLFSDARSDLESRLQIASFDFPELPSPTLSGALRDDLAIYAGGIQFVADDCDENPSAFDQAKGNSLVSTRTGRPAAQWWDDLWIEIFRQIYLGDMKPKTQADIVRAMRDWLEAQGLSVADSTLKPRARKLFAMLEAADSN